MHRRGRQLSLFYSHGGVRAGGRSEMVERCLQVRPCKRPLERMPINLQIKGYRAIYRNILYVSLCPQMPIEL